MEEGTDNSNSANGGSSGALGSNVVPEEGRIAGFDFLDPRKPGYLERSRFKPSLRTRLPRMDGSRTPRPVWPRFSLVRRYLPVSALTAVVYVGVLRIMILFLALAMTADTFAVFWRTRLAGGVSTLGWFGLVNVAFILWVAIDFFQACRDRRRPGLGQKVGYVFALVLLGALQFAYDRVDYATDYFYKLAVMDDLAHPSLMLRIPPEQQPAADRPLTFEQCPVGVELDKDPNWGNMHVYNFLEWEAPASNRFKGPGALQRFDVTEMPAEMRRRAATANPRWLLIETTFRCDFSWREVVEVCAEAFDAGFERVFLRDGQRAVRFWSGPKPPPPNVKTGPIYSVAEVVPVEPTGWRRGIGREYEGKRLVRVWACLGRESP